MTILGYGLHYGYDPDTDGKSLYLWDVKRHYVAKWPFIGKTVKLWRRK